MTKLLAGIFLWLCVLTFTATLSFASDPGRFTIGVEVPLSQTWIQSEAVLSTLEVEKEEAKVGEVVQVTVTLQGYERKPLPDRETVIYFRSEGGVAEETSGMTDYLGKFTTTVTSMDPLTVRIEVFDVSYEQPVKIIQEEEIAFLPNSNNRKFSASTQPEEADVVLRSPTQISPISLLQAFIAFLLRFVSW